jgi:hypothetical protein
MKLDLKTTAQQTFEKLVNPKYKLLKTYTIYFEKEGGEISSVSALDGYNICFRKDGSRIFPRGSGWKRISRYDKLY